MSTESPDWDALTDAAADEATEHAEAHYYGDNRPARTALRTAISRLIEERDAATREAFQYGIAAQDHNAQHAEDAATISRLQSSLVDARKDSERLREEISAIAASAEAEEVPSRKQITVTVTFDQGAIMLVGPRLVETHLLKLYDRIKDGYEKRVLASRLTPVSDTETPK